MGKKWYIVTVFQKKTECHHADTIGHARQDFSRPRRIKRIIRPYMFFTGGNADGLVLDSADHPGRGDRPVRGDVCLEQSHAEKGRTGKKRKGQPPVKVAAGSKAHETGTGFQRKSTFFGMPAMKSEGCRDH